MLLVVVGLVGPEKQTDGEHKLVKRGERERERDGRCRGHLVFYQRVKLHQSLSLLLGSDSEVQRERGVSKLHVIEN